LVENEEQNQDTKTIDDLESKSAPERPKSSSNYVSPTGRTDGRVPYEWESKYPESAKKYIRIEGGYLIVLFFLSLSLIFSNWNGWLATTLSIPPNGAFIFKKYAYYASSGLLGGVIFDVKNFYRSLASGWWHLDRRAWRFLSPLLGLATAIVIGAMIDASLISAEEPTMGAAFLSIGFLSGYFADKAIAKMGEVADVIFGKSVTSKD